MLCDGTQVSLELCGARLSNLKVLSVIEPWDDLSKNSNTDYYRVQSSKY